MAAWANVVLQAGVAPADMLVWTASTVAPVNQGKRREDGSWKFRPIGLMEPLTKFVEGVATRKCLPQVRAHIEPQAFGLAPEGLATCAKLLRGWLTDAVDPDVPQDDPMVMVKTDLRNAYGALRRAGALAALRDCCPGLAGLLAVTWSAGRCTRGCAVTVAGGAAMVIGLTAPRAVFL